MHKRAALTLIVLFGVLAIGFGVLVTKQIRLQSPIVLLDEPQRVVTDEQRGKLAADRALLAPIESPLQQTGRLSRDEALRLYGNSMITFDTQCKASPTFLSVVKRRIIMFNNQSAVIREISIDARSYSIPANDFSLMAANTAGDFPIRCDGTTQARLLVIE